MDIERIKARLKELEPEAADLLDNFGIDIMDFAACKICEEMGLTDEESTRLSEAMRVGIVFDVDDLFDGHHSTGKK